MTLLMTIFAAIICTILWYKKPRNDEMKISMLCLMFWGASLMWLVDAVFEYVEIGAELFTPSFADMMNDFYLGLSVIALGLATWLVILMIKDPKGVLKATLFKKK